VTSVAHTPHETNLDENALAHTIVLDTSASHVSYFLVLRLTTHCWPNSNITVCSHSQHVFTGCNKQSSELLR